MSEEEQSYSSNGNQSQREESDSENESKDEVQQGSKQNQQKQLNKQDKQAEQDKVEDLISMNEPSFFSLSQTDIRIQEIKPRRRGRPAKVRKDAVQSSMYMKQEKSKKLAKIQEYEQALKKIRSQPKQFHQPFENVKLNIDKPATIQMCKDARDHNKNLRFAVREVGIRHQRNLFKFGVNQQLTYVIDYLQNGKIPRWIKDSFEELLEKDLSKSNNSIVQTSVNFI